MSELPEGWTSTNLANVGRWCSGGTPSRTRADYFGEGIPWVKSGDLHNGPILHTGEHITELGLNNSSAKLMPAGTISLALYGATIGKLGVLTFPAVTNQACANVIPNGDLIDPQYLFFYLMSERENLIEKGQGGAQPNISQEIVKSHPIGLAPLCEQRRIVAKVEKLLSRVGAAQARLATIPRILKRFRQSVLAAACSGKVTADWRQINTNVELAGEFQKRIQSDRRALWERVELRKMKAKGLATRDNKWKEKYQEPNHKEEGELDELPPLWKWRKLDTFLAYIEAGKSFNCTERPPLANEVGVLKVSAVTWGEFDENESKTCNDRRLINPDIQVRVGDFLFSRANTLELVGACVIVKKVSSNVMLSDKTLRFHIAGMLQEYVLYVLRSSIGRAEIERLATGNQNSMRNIGQERIRDILVPVPPFAEQQEIVRRVEALFKTADALEARYHTAKAHVDKLTQSILAKAFRGELVPQDPNDEPASVLLERIKKENQEKNSGKVARPKRRRAAAFS